MKKRMETMKKRMGVLDAIAGQLDAVFTPEDWEKLHNGELVRRTDLEFSQLCSCGKAELPNTRKPHSKFFTCHYCGLLYYAWTNDAHWPESWHLVEGGSIDVGGGWGKLKIKEKPNEYLD